MTAVWRAALVLAVLFLGWKALALNLSEHYLQRAYDGDDSALQTALWWHEHPAAVELAARRALRGEQGPDSANRDRAVAGLEQSLALDPTAQRAVATLARLYGDQARPEALPLAGVADRLGPSDWRAQNDLARLHAGLGRLDAAVPHLARAMTGSAELARGYFPALEQVAADPQSLSLLAPVTDDPRDYPWWDAFFDYLAREAQTVVPLRNIVALRERASAYPLQMRERNAYVQRLRRDGLMSEAYLYWVNGLPPDDLASLGYVYDGGFQRPFDNDAGFGWYATPPQNSGIRVSRGDTYGATGDYAMRLSFRGRRVRFSHVWQHLFVPPGDYSVSGRVRPDQLEARRGLQWRLYCETGDAGLLGQSELFSGTGDWREFSFQVTVPDGCTGQTLRLYSAGDRVVDHELAGTIWFDDMRVELRR